MYFARIAGGTFSMGMSDKERLALENRRNDHEAEFVDEFLKEVLPLVSPPILVDVQTFLIAESPIGHDFAKQHWTSLELIDADRVAYFTQLEELESILGRYGLQVPSESEWEFTYRSLNDFSSLPINFKLEFEPCDRLSGIGTYAEICADSWSDSIASMPLDGRARVGAKARTIRGGAGQCYPWQGCGEWLMLMPFSRFSSEHLDYMSYSLRPAADIPQS